jgi:hypothetical protein
MQVILKNILKAYSGKCDGLIYYYHAGLGRLLCRRHTIPRPSESNARFTRIAANLKALNPSPEYCTDLKYYAALISRPGAQLNWRNVFMRLMYAVAREYGANLETLTRADIYAQDLPCKSVKAAIDERLLTPVTGYERLNALM